MKVPTPAEVGLPSQFREWRPNQWQAIKDGLECPTRFCVLRQRAGAGKTVTGMAQAMLRPDDRFIYLTIQKGLQDQLLSKFPELGIADIRGKATYHCEGRPGQNCDEGSISRCMFKGTSLCNYQSARQFMTDSRIGTTNYSCWIASYKYGQGFGKYDFMYLDEAHNAPDQVAKAMQIQISERELTEILDREWPDYRSRTDMEAWKHWSKVSYTMASEELQRLKNELDKTKRPSSGTIKRFQHVNNLVRRLADIATCNPADWIADSYQHGYQFDPLDVSAYAERILFRGVSKVILTSATIHPKTMEMLGVSEDDYTVYDYPRTINPARSPIMYIPTARVNYYSQPWELKRLVARIDEIFEGRTDRKGVVHTSNKQIRDFIMSNSRYARFFVSNYSQNGDLTSDVVERFRRANAPCLFVSPSIVQGYDLPYDDCRYQIIAKLNWPNNSSKAEAARMEADRERSAFKVWQSLQQAVGRGDRADDDAQEVFILDDSMRGLVWKSSHLADPSFFAYYKQVDKVPPALEIAA